MLDNATALTIIERAEAETPLCWCNAPTAAVVHDGSIWLRCRSDKKETQAGNGWL